jgi:hypothetical protein
MKKLVAKRTGPARDTEAARATKAVRTDLKRIVKRLQRIDGE